MQTTSLEVQKREDQGKGAARKLRAMLRIPAVLYGEGEKAQSVVVDRKTFDSLLRDGKHHGLLDLSYDGGAPFKALVREVQVHPVSREVLHVDLQRVSMRNKIHIDVQIALVGKPEGVKNQGGILEHNLRSIEVECLPGDIPPQIEIDVSNLLIGQSIHVSDLDIPNVTFTAHPGTTIATVSLPAAERAVEEAVAEAVTPAEGEAAAAGEEGKAASGDKEKAAGGKDSKGGKDKDAKGGKS